MREFTDHTQTHKRDSEAPGGPAASDGSPVSWRFMQLRNAEAPVRAAAVILDFLDASVSGM